MFIGGATQFASTYLVRPDGSGGARVAFELDGCMRVAGLGPYREVPAELRAILADI